MKIQAHPGLPAMPLMFSIAAESKPEKAPESWLNLRGLKIWLNISQPTEAVELNKAILKINEGWSPPEQ